MDPAIVSLIPSGFVKSSLVFFPLAELTNIKGSADAGVEIDQGRIAEDFLKSEKHFLCKLQIHNDQAHQAKTDIAILVDLMKDISLLVGMWAGVGGGG